MLKDAWPEIVANLAAPVMRAFTTDIALSPTWGTRAVLEVAFVRLSDDKAECAPGRGWVLGKKLMDVLQHWSPIIDQAAFRQGPISDEVWRCFKQVVQLCHAFRHWEQDAHNKRLSPPRMYSVPAESKRQFKKRQDEWKEDIRRSENHRNRAQFLADDTVARLSYLGTNARANEAPEDELVRTADWKLWFALRVAVRAHPRACAFEAFDADKELEATGDENCRAVAATGRIFHLSGWAESRMTSVHSIASSQ